MDIANLLSQRNGSAQAGNGTAKGLPVMAEVEGGGAGEKFDRLLTNFLTLTMDAGRTTTTTTTTTKGTGDTAVQDKAQIAGRERRWDQIGINLLPQTEQAEQPVLTAEVAAFLDELSTLMGQKESVPAIKVDEGQEEGETVPAETASTEQDDSNVDAVPVASWPPPPPAETSAMPRFGIPADSIALDASRAMMNTAAPAMGTPAAQAGITASGRPAPIIPVAFPQTGGEQEGPQSGNMMPPMPMLRGFMADAGAGRTTGEQMTGEQILGLRMAAVERGQPGAIALPAGMVPVSDVKTQTMQAVSTLALSAKANADVPAAAVTQGATMAPAAADAQGNVVAPANMAPVAAITPYTVPADSSSKPPAPIDIVQQVSGATAARADTMDDQADTGPVADPAAPVLAAPKADMPVVTADQAVAKAKIAMPTEAQATTPATPPENPAPATDQVDPATIQAEMAGKPAPLSDHGPVAKTRMAATAAPKTDDDAADMTAKAADAQAQEASELPEGETNKRMLAPRHVSRDGGPAGAEDGTAQIAGQMAAQPQAPRTMPDMAPVVRTPSVADNLLSRAVAAASGSSGSELSADGHPDAGLTAGSSSDMTGLTGNAMSDTKVQGADFAQHLRQTSAPGRAGAPPPPPHQIAIQVQRAVQEGQDRLSIQLRPLDLGRIDVQLDFGSEGKLRAKVTADSAQTLELLQKDAKSLERSLQEAGLEMDKGGLSFSLRDPGDQAQRGNDRKQEDGRSGTKTASTQPEDETPASPAYRPVLEPGRVDVRI